MTGIDGIDGMGNAMGLDEVDLFGDPVIARAPPPSKQLRLRLDELRTRGCCQAIAWSRQGTIASVSKNATSIDLRFLRCHPDTGAWDMSAPTPCSVLSPVQSGVPIVHLAWAPTSSPELAVIDAVGRISILSFSITLNRPYATRKWDADAVDDLNAVVGCYWLPLTTPGRQFHVMYGPAVWSTTEYKIENTILASSGPWHPNSGKSALLCVTAGGFLKLLFSQNNNRIEETSLELESVTSSDDLITHASICSNRNTLLIALATSSRQLRVVQVAVQWGTPQPADKQAQAPPGSMHLSPSLKERNVAVTSWFQHGPGESIVDMSMTQLSHVEMLPSVGDHTSEAQAPPVVLTVRSHIPQDGSLYNQECQSIIDRWEVLSDRPQALHGAFDQLGSKNSSSQIPPMTRLRKLDSIVVPKVVISIHTMQLGKVICFAFSDGTVQYRDRITMNEVYNEHNLSTIMSPHQVGFQFTNETPCLQAAFSPTNCSFVQICEDASIKWNKLRFPMENLSAALQGNQFSAILAALSISISPAAYHQMNCDDILAIARPFTQKPDFGYTWVRAIVNMIKVAVDYSEDSHHDQLVRNHHLQFCLSILNHLGFHGEFQPRSFGGKFAMLALNVRNIVILITIANNTPVNLKEKLSPLDDAEVVEALAGCARWAVDLLSWLSDCIFNLWNEPTFRAIIEDPKRFPELSNYMQARGDVSLHLLLCSSTRGFLSAACRRLIHLEALSNRAIQFYQKTMTPEAASRPAPALYVAYMRMQRATSSSLIKVAEFEKLVAALSAEIRTSYQKSLAGLAARSQQDPKSGQQQGPDQVVKRAQTHAELDMLLAGNPPPSFREMLVRFFKANVAAFKAQTDPAKLYFSNFELLEVEDDAGSLALKKAKGGYIDVFKRVAMVKPGEGEEGPQWRRCARCASVMEDVLGNRPGFTFVLAQQRKCSCGGNWGLLPKGSLVN
ncbi:RNA polymerase II mediator complex subunit Sin4 [Cercophora newfieldiana]|uniref:Mediator of RNA polymerase II transcription subunit 16 n=1 Tax=Cercophora newfieldiana TaxID=92897 RepID=A0AA40CYK1_9PEZI|nr:RNA polymerase II mediator complex subunit Sin4 [Cercophora newfieldiana]